ncbi:hypothetical protein AVEN_215644-1 [Araneus ventricosus]|uniref:ATP-dependent DNA helicase n=1 Tax=Araneus ventricosus TaxID=182803 RepID=A0A4Y2PQ83_ARAVE|nr:hypothetical protein AVEN_17352-1 [Araneus ventricosus]GBN53118.1 hypothetical protein AVEN_55228-1 [Araneus ventricosus]GBN53143.1 hypothetical protein AVEN_78667-1 [Araneus ventricosus]GBN53199.1 hypothetical protein AVEN_215644-1 [Araneus ventricosus]
MVDDIFPRSQRHDENIEYSDVIYSEALTRVEDQVITISGKDLSCFGLSRPSRTVSNDLMQELDYDTEVLQQRLNEFVPRLNPGQKTVFDVSKQVESGEGGLFFLDTPGGTGKNFLLNLLLSQIRKDKKKLPLQ